MGITVPACPVSSITTRLEGSCECVLEMVTPSAGGQCLGLSPGKATSQQRSSVAQLSLQGPWSDIDIFSGLNLNFSFLAHTMGLIRVPNSCVTEKMQSSLSSGQHRAWHMVGALWGSEGATVPDRAPPLSLQATSSSRSRRS